MESFIKETLYLLPDSLIYGSFLFGLITLSFQHSLFFVSILESLVFLFGFQSIGAYLFGNSIDNLTCKPSLFKYTFENIFMKSSALSIPSYGIYIVSFASTYLASSLFSVKSELDVLDSSYIKQYNYGLLSLALLVLSYSFFRVFFKCDSSLSIILGLVLGSVVGFMISYQNTHLFGKNSINFMGIPLLRSKTANGAPIYICS